jgi:hypothetical protein
MKRLAIAAVLGLSLTALAQDAPPRVVVHEWGTFTAVFGADGTMLDWRPLVGSDLPKFVYDRATVLPRKGWRAKEEIVSYERMETPVLYFYADRDAKLDVTVRFPKGLITEWYPLVHELAPVIGTEPPKVEGGAVRWQGVEVLPRSDAAPPAAGENHYAYARETDSAMLRVRHALDEGRSEYEKFLFYRGVGSFDLPLAIRTAEGGRFTFTAGAHPVRHIYALEVSRDGSGRFAALDAVPARASAELAVTGEPLPAARFVEQIGARLEESLVAEGLYRKEARSMVKTWTDSYFQTEGTRLLYVVPEVLTNELLPLEIKPAPAELKRVLVARVDVMRPEQTREIQALLRELGGDTFEARAQAEKRIASFGRFAEPALKEAIRTADDAEVRERAKALLAALSPRR